jgi:phosphate transport system substrate-binding protein
MTRSVRALGSAVAALSLVIAGCGGSSGGGSDLTGGIFVSGSSTVEPISALVAALFAGENPGVEITVEGISVLTSPQNSAVTCLNTADLYALSGPESEGFDTWSAANDLGGEVGGIGVPYPDAPLDITAPGEESGTFDAYIELAGFEDIGVERGLSEDEAATTRPDYQSSSNDNVIIEGIAGSPSSFGWVGFSFYQENQDIVKAIEISADDESGCVAPTFETISDASYPLSRSLYIYVNNEKAAENEALRAYVDFYLSDDGLRTAVQDVSYVVLPDDRIEATRSAWEGGPA